MSRSDGDAAARELAQDPSGHVTAAHVSLGKPPTRIVGRPMAAFQYRYELRRVEELVATGHLTREHPFELGDRIALGGSAGTVRAVDPFLANASCGWWCRSRAKEGTRSPRAYSAPAAKSPIERPCRPEARRVIARYADPLLSSSALAPSLRDGPMRTTSLAFRLASRYIRGSDRSGVPCRFVTR